MSTQYRRVCKIRVLKVERRLTLPPKNVPLAECFNASKEDGNDEDSAPLSANRTQLPRVCLGNPSTRGVTDDSCPALTSRTASSLNSSVYRAR